MFDEIIAPLLVTKWGRHLGWGVMILLIALTIILFIDTVYTWHKDWVMTRSAAPATIQFTTSDQAEKIIAGLPKQHIFGRSDAVDQNAVPITSLQLKLVGVIKAQPDEFSRVIISEGGKPGKVYRVGDTLTGSVRVHSISNEGVVLENEGQFEKLPLQRLPVHFQGMPKPLLPSETKLEE